MGIRGIKLSVLVGLVSLLASVGCGDDGGGDDDDEPGNTAGSGGGNGDACKTFKACGGNPEGSWSVKDVCLANGADVFSQELGGECADAFVGIDTTTSGTYSLTADKMASSNISLGVVVELSFTDACVKTLGSTGTAAAECSKLGADFAADKANFESASCSVKDGKCNCKLGAPKTALMDTATYSVSGNNLVVDGASQPFCVSGSTLTIQASVEGAMATFTLSK